MAQISSLPLVAGTEASASASVGADSNQLGLTAEGQVIGFSFDQTLKQLLESQEDGDVMLLYAMQQPMVTDPQLTPQALLSKDGNLLPLTLEVDGKSLPVMVRAGMVSPLNPQQPLPQPVSAEPTLPNLVLTGLTGEQKPLLNELVARVEGHSLVDPLKTSETSSANPQSLLTQPAVTGNVQARGGLALPLNLPVGQPGWDQAVGERVQWMVNQNIQQAEIKLTPPNLGPLEIKISVQHDQTHVTFLAAQAPTREALEASIPRLREMLGDINLNLANVNVGQQQAGAGGSERGGATDNPGYPGGNGTELSSAPLSTERPGMRLAGQGLLDTYA